MIKRLSNYYQIFKESKFYKNIWSDAVWSKVISAGIIFLLGTFITTIYLLIKSIIFNIPFKELINKIILFLNSKTEINNIILIFASVIILISLFFFYKSIKSKFFINKPEIIEEKEEELPIIGEHSTSFFSYRLAKSFPGQRGLRWYNNIESTKRLKILFKEPLRFKSVVFDCPSDPIWWFRGRRAMFIDTFETLSKTKILLGIEEIEIEKIGVYISDAYYQSFIYVVAKAEKQTGIYNKSDDDIKLFKEMWGYYNEEFALLGKKVINRQEYDDGAAIINDKIIDASDAKLRLRYLTPYNFIIAAKQSPYNSRIFTQNTDKMFNDLLENKITFESFLEFMVSLEKKD
jgi:hypothetical protein